MFARWTEKLSERDRRVLRVALPVAAVLVALLVLKPLLGGRQAAELRLERALEDIAWLQAQRRRVAAPVCDPALSGLAPRELADRFDVTLSESGGERLVINDGAGNQVLAYMRALSCSDAGLAAFQLETAASRGRVSGEVRLAREAL